MLFRWHFKSVVFCFFSEIYISCILYIYVMYVWVGKQLVDIKKSSKCVHNLLISLEMTLNIIYML